jgi:CDP-glycerol glycerophosphotransferase
MNLNTYSKPVIFLTTLLGWIFIVPLTYLIPKKKNLMVLMGAKDGFFIDNVKFFFSLPGRRKKRSGFLPTYCKQRNLRDFKS